MPVGKHERTKQSIETPYCLQMATPTKLPFCLSTRDSSKECENIFGERNGAVKFFLVTAQIIAKAP